MATHWIEAWPEIAERFAAPARLLVACDFDGTLAPLALDPDQVQLPATALTALRQLQASPGVTLAIITGRSLADIVGRIALPDAIFAGNHGLEVRGLGFDGAHPGAVALSPRLRSMVQQLEVVLASVPGIRIENKGLSVAIHLRNVKEVTHDHVTREVRRIGGTDQAFRVQHGHLIVELIPDIGWSKGAALNQIIGRMGLPGSASFFAGDDTTDESVFIAFPTAITISVGPHWVSAARWMARDPGDLCVLLDRLACTRRSGPTAGSKRPS